MNKVYKIAMNFMFVILILLFILCFNIDMNFNFINKEILNNLFNYSFNFNAIFNDYDKDHIVNNDILYIKVNDQYISNSNYLYSLDEGIVKNIDFNKIIIKLYSGYLLIFNGIFSNYVFINDYVSKNSIIGEYYNPFFINIIKDGVYYTYEEYLKFNF